MKNLRKFRKCVVTVDVKKKKKRKIDEFANKILHNPYNCSPMGIYYRRDYTATNYL